MPTVAQGIAQAFADAGVQVVTHVPGFGATSVFEAWRQSEPISFHEEPAFAVAFGAALRGVRAASVMKVHGVLKAANALSTALSCGTTAGLVLVAVDDPTGAHSDNILDAEAILSGLGLPFRRITAANAREAVREAVVDAERTGLFQTVLVDADVCGARLTDGSSPEASPPLPPYRRDPARHLVCPALSGYQHAVLSARRRGDDPDSIARPTLWPVPHGAPEPIRPLLQRYLPFFELFRERRRDFVSGDTSLPSLFGLPPFECIDAVCYLGGSIPLASGASLAGGGSVWALTGDFSFVAAGGLGLVEASMRKVPLRVVIFANGRAEATGGQEVPRPLLDAALAPHAESVRRVALTDRAELGRALEELEATVELRILLVECA